MGASEEAYRYLSSIRASDPQNKPWRIEAKVSTDTTDVYLFDEIGPWGVTARDFVRELQGITTSKIDLHMSTPGGDVFDGIAIYNSLKNHSASVTVYVESLAASAGSFIAQAGDKVIMQAHSSMMIHDAHGLTIGNAAVMREMADLLDKTSDNIASIYAGRAGGSTQDWRERMQAENWYSAEEAVDIGLADEVAEDEARNHAPSIAAQMPAAEPQRPPAGTEEEEFDYDPAMIRAALQEALGA